MPPAMTLLCDTWPPVLKPFLKPPDGDFGATAFGAIGLDFGTALGTDGERGGLMLGALGGAPPPFGSAKANPSIKDSKMIPLKFFMEPHEKQGAT